MPKEPRKAFTLIELLVVISIISILAAILFPVFARARENARRTSCLSNMKQIGLGAMQYVQDYDGRFPQGYPRNGADPIVDADKSRPSGNFVAYINTSGNYRTWMDLIFPYVKSTQVFACPSASGGHAKYGYNAVFGGVGSDCYWYRGTCDYNISMQESAVNRPAEIIMFMDRTNNVSHRTFPYHMSGALTPVANYENTVVPHLEGGNQVFADGHAKWQPATRIYQPNITTYCNLNTVPDVPFCSRAWNPYLP